MERRNVAILRGLIATILSVLGIGPADTNCQALPPPPTPVRKSVSFEEQLEIFRRLGFVLNPSIGSSEIEDLRNDKLITERPYSILYMELGRTIQREPWTPLTNRCWDFDTEAIEDHGAYVEIMKNLERISRGELKLENLKDYVDVENEKAWVSFAVKGIKYRWDLKVNDDWVDESLFTRVVALTTQLRTKGRYTYFDTGGQNAVIGYETPDGRNAIIKVTGLKIEWLN